MGQAEILPSRACQKKWYYLRFFCGDKPITVSTGTMWNNLICLWAVSEHVVHHKNCVETCDLCGNKFPSCPFSIQMWCQVMCPPCKVCKINFAHRTTWGIAMRMNWGTPGSTRSQKKTLAFTISEFFVQPNMWNITNLISRSIQNKKFHTIGRSYRC